MVRILVFFVVIVALVGAGFYASRRLPSPASARAAVAQVGQRIKTSGCHVAGPLQDHACTPGAVNTALTKDALCSAGFSTKSVRNVPSQEKAAVYQEYGIASHRPGEYEVDHLISLELGGSNDIANLWPEAAEPRPGFHEKDLVENYLHKQVCSGAIPLADAQQKIATDWLAVYQNTANIQAYR